MTDANTIDSELLAEMRAAGLMNDVVLASVLHNNETASPPPVEIEEIDPVELAEQIQKQEAREAIYEAQESVNDMIENAPVVPKKSRAKKEKAEKPAKVAKEPKEKKVTTPRMSRIAASGNLTQHVVKTIGASVILQINLPEFQTDALISGMPVKIQEKAANFFDHLCNDKRLSVFTQTGIDCLRLTGKLTGKILIDEYQSGPDPYSIGTARSQSQQIVSLFKTLRIIKADGSIEEESALWLRISDLFSAK